MPLSKKGRVYIAEDILSEYVETSKDSLNFIKITIKHCNVEILWLQFHKIHTETNDS